MRASTKLFAILFLIAVTATGCLGQTRTRGRVIGGSLAALSAFMIVDSLTGTCDSDSIGEAAACGAYQQGGPYMGAVYLFAASALLFYNERRTLPSEQPPPAEPPPAPARIAGADRIPEPAASDPMLRQLTVQASLAARANHCVVVRTIADRVDRIDRAYRNGGFVADSVIAACL